MLSCYCNYITSNLFPPPLHQVYKALLEPVNVKAIFKSSTALSDASDIIGMIFKLQKKKEER